MALKDLQQEDYKVDLDIFEGPLDLLLYLIRRDEVDIYDIPIERVTRQYMDYLDMMRMLDLNIAGEFLVMATTLMMIKSRMLLPVIARRGEGEDEEEAEWIDPRMELVRQLIEYKKFKDAAGALASRELLQSAIFNFGAESGYVEDETTQTTLSLGDIGLFDLLTAFQTVLERAPTEPFGHLEEIRWTVPDKMDHILRLTKASDEGVRFMQLFDALSPRGEIIITFLALLELLRLRQINARQNEAFHDIVILPSAEEPNGTPLP